MRGDQPRRAAGQRRDDERVEVELAHGRAGAVGDRVGGVALVAAHAVLVPALVRRDRARSCSAIAAIIATAATGWAPTAVSWESITASVPSRIALATSATSARVGRDEWTIESSIWVAVIDGRASWPASASRRFWTIGTSSMRHLDAEVAARDHHAVGGLDDLLGALDRLRLLDLGDQRQARVLAHARDVLGAAHERERDEVDADRLAEASMLEVLLGHARAGCAISPGMFRPWREATAPPISTSASISPSPARDLDDAQAHRAVGEVEDVARLDGASARPAQAIDMPLARRRRRAVGAADGRRRRRRRAARRCRRASGADAQLRTREVLQDRHRPPGAAGRVAHALGGLGVLLVACRGRSSAARRPCPPRSCATSVSGSREAGPMVATILVRRRTHRTVAACAAAGVATAC